MTGGVARVAALLFCCSEVEVDARSVRLSCAGAVRYVTLR